jgi:predicted regulator of Ras-like GTPase activity (Roadblock/LC7/MglB family)
LMLALNDSAAIAGIFGRLMASLQDFVGEISKVHGVRGYSVLRRDGQILSQNVRIADRLSAMAALSGLSCESVMTAAGLSRFRCLVLARGKREKLLVFPTKQCFLLVIEGSDVYTLDLLRSVEEVIQRSLPF